MQASAVVFIASLTLVQSGCRDQHGTKVAASGPRLIVPETHYDFGPALTHDELRHAFQLANTGGAPLEITSIEVSRECSVNARALTLKANARAELGVTCKPNEYGAFVSTVTLRSNDPRPEPAVLELSAAVSPRLAWKEPVLALELAFGDQRRQEVELIGARARDARLSLQGAADAGLGFEILQGGAGDRLEVHASGQSVGTRIGELKVATGLDDPAELGLPFSFTVTGTLTVDPQNPYFDLLRASGRRVELTVKSAQSGFRVLGVDVLDGPFQASFSRAPGGAYHIVVTFLAGRVSGEQRGTLGHLRLRSSDRSEPEKVLALLAFGRAASEP